MSVYLGMIFHKNSYVNFKPLYEYRSGQFFVLDSYERQELLPESENRTINFYSSKADFIVDDEFLNEELVLFEFASADELEDNVVRGERNLTGYKVDVSKLSPKKIRRLPDIGYYYCVQPEYIDGDYKTSQVLVLTDPYVFSGMQVMIPVKEDPSILIGPLTVDMAPNDDRCIVKTGFMSQKYIIWGCRYSTNYINLIKEFGTFDFKLPYIEVADDICEQIPIDVIPPEQLLRSFRETLGSEDFIDGKLNLDNIEAIIKKYKSSLFTGIQIPEEIRAQRLEELTNLLTSEEQVNSTFGFIADTIGSFLLKHQDDEGYSELIARISKSPDFIENIQKYKIIEDKLAKKEAELRRINSEIQEQQTALADLKTQSSAATVIEGHEAEIEDLKKRKAELEVDIRKAIDTLKDVDSIEDLERKSSALTTEIGHKEYQRDQLKAGLQTLETRLDSIFTNSTEKAMQFVFDGMLSSRMMQQAALWEKQQNCSHYDAVVEKLIKLPHSPKTGNELIEYLVSKIKEYRPNYDRNTILNILICVSQGFLTVFAGEPGTGKTSICKIIANVLGLTMPSMSIGSIDGICCDRFVNISVEKGWTTKRDFVGYYNPLTKTFDRSNRKMFDSLNILDIEAKGRPSDLPYLILLDEANLSPMEYYWADYMNICDDLDQNSTINLGDDYCFAVPNNLRFLATINNDHTTEALSPRLIDRAWVIRLPKTKSGAMKTMKLSLDDVEIISWTALSQALDVSSYENEISISGPAKEIYEIVLSKLKEAKVSVSTRVDSAINRYWYVAQQLFETDTAYGTDATVVALDYAIAQRILPHINCSGEKLRESLNEILKVLNDNNLRYSAEILSDIIQKGDEMMSYYQFFA